MREQEQAAREQLQKINGWTREELDNYIEDCFEQWRARSARSWTADLSYLKENFGIDVASESAQARADRAEEAYKVIAEAQQKGEFLEHEEILRRAGVSESAARFPSDEKLVQAPPLPSSVPVPVKHGFIHALKAFFGIR